jgi:UDP-N-acetylglucosamine:LPS N-acetylglucosamine transferase
MCARIGAKAGDMPSARFHALDPASYVPDQIHAADCVLGKLGYGFVSECVTSGTALIFVPRVDWPEERYLEVRRCLSPAACLLLRADSSCIPASYLQGAKLACYITAPC